MNSDFKDLLSAFDAHGVECLIVGAHAMAVHGHVRATKDLDLWVRPSVENAARVLRAMTDFGAPLHDLSEADLSSPGLVFQIGVPPLRVDILTAIDGVEFETAWPRRVLASIGQLQAPVLARADLLRNKRASGSLQDLADAEHLERLGQGEA